MAKKILLIDDDAELCQELAEVLRDEGYLVDEACDVSQGEIFIKQNSYDICLFDYKMPGLSGVDLLRSLKKRSPQSAVLIISGRPLIEEILKKENVSHLVAAVVNKPFDIKILLQSIKRFM